MNSIQDMAARPRRSNADRSAATREKILNATIDCLYALGYHQTTTVVVTQRAGVSRGAMLHHFPSKADLMIAAMDHIRGRMGAAHAAKLAPIEDRRERFAALVDILWGEYSQPVGVARIELILASRSDPICGPHFAALTVELDRRHKEVVWPLATVLELNGTTTGSSLSVPKVAVMARSGRTQVSPPLPHCMDFGQSKPVITLGRRFARMSVASAPCLSIWAT